MICTHIICFGVPLQSTKMNSLKLAFVYPSNLVILIRISFAWKIFPLQTSEAPGKKNCIKWMLMDSPKLSLHFNRKVHAWRWRLRIFRWFCSVWLIRKLWKFHFLVWDGLSSINFIVLLQIRTIFIKLSTRQKPLFCLFSLPFLTLVSCMWLFLYFAERVQRFWIQYHLD